MSLNRVCGKLQRCQTLGSKRKTKKKNGKCSTHCRSCVSPFILQTTHNWTVFILCSFFVSCFFNTYYCCCNSNFVYLSTWSFIMATRGEHYITHWKVFDHRLSFAFSCWASPSFLAHCFLHCALTNWMFGRGCLNLFQSAFWMQIIKTLISLQDLFTSLLWKGCPKGNLSRVDRHMNL